MHLCRTLPWTRIFPKVLAFPAGLEAKHMYCPESTPVRLSKINVQEPSGSSIIMWWGSTSTGFPSERQKGEKKLVSIMFSPWEFHPAFLLERTESCICFFAADVGSWGMSSSSSSSSLQNIPPGKALLRDLIHHQSSFKSEIFPECALCSYSSDLLATGTPPQWL